MTCECKSCGPLGGHEHGDTGAGSSGLGMEHPEAAVEVEVKASKAYSAAEVRLIIWPISRDRGRLRHIPFYCWQDEKKLFGYKVNLLVRPCSCKK